MRLNVEHSSIIDPIHDQILPLYFETQLPFLVGVSCMEEHGSSGLNDVDFLVRYLDLEEIERMGQNQQKIIAESQHDSTMQQKRVF